MASGKLEPVDTRPGHCKSTGVRLIGPITHHFGMNGHIPEHFSVGFLYESPPLADPQLPQLESQSNAFEGCAGSRVTAQVTFQRLPGTFHPRADCASAAGTFRGRHRTSLRTRG